jgi:hypothetical protein
LGNLETADSLSHLDILPERTAEQGGGLLRFRPLGYSIPEEIGAFSCDPEDKQLILHRKATNLFSQKSLKLLDAFGSRGKLWIWKKNGKNRAFSLDRLS